MRPLEKEYVSYTELYLAYLDCRRKKRSSPSEICFEMDDNLKLFRLYYRLNELKYEIGTSITFIIEDPVVREIFAADFIDRIIHHLLIRRIHFYLEQYLYSESYSCRIGKGTLYGIKRCAEMMKECSNNYTEDCYILKCDIRAFFLSIDRRLLYNITAGFLKDVCKFEGDYLFFTDYLLKCILFDDARKKCKYVGNKSLRKKLPYHKSWMNCDDYTGLPIGNLPSQVLANLFMRLFDWFVVKTLGVKYYGRYVDDFFLIDKSKKYLKYCLSRIRGKLKELKLTLHQHKIYLQHIKMGVRFIGAIIKPYRTYIINRTKGKLWEVIHKTEEPHIMSDIRHFVGSINSYLGFMVHHATYNIRKEALLSNEFRWFFKYGMVSAAYNKIILDKRFRFAMT